MAWSAPRTWVTSEIVTAALMNAHVRDNLLALNGFVRKTADQSVASSAVLVNDTHLLYAIPAAGTYKFEVCLIALTAANAAGDIQFAFTFPTGTCTFGITAQTTAIAAPPYVGDVVLTGASAATSGTSPSGMSGGLTVNEGFIWLKGVLVATAAGTLRLQWAQLAANASATTVKAGSFMEVQQVA